MPLNRTRNVVLAAGVLGATITGVGVAATGDPFREGVRNGTTSAETEIIANIQAASGLKGGYATRQSNLSDSGGGAVYGCRSAAGGSGATPPRNPCIRANNLNNGYAFEFNASSGESVGAITAGTGGDAKKPFVTNATGVATGLNADRVDGQEADALKTRWALVTETGEIEAQSGGFSLVTAYPGGADPAGNQNVYVKTGADARNKGLTASIAIQNTGSNGNTNNFGGEISVGACGLASINCVPANTEADDVLVLSPRKSDGTVTEPGARKRFYVQISE